MSAREREDAPEPGPTEPLPHDSFWRFLVRRRRAWLVPLLALLVVLWLAVSAAEIGFVIDVLAPS